MKTTYDQPQGKEGILQARKSLKYQQTTIQHWTKQAKAHNSTMPKRVSKERI